jgi:hypothetical protein
MDLKFDTTLANTAACDAVPQSGDLGLANARIIAPGAPDRSVLVARMDRRDAQAMPPLASNAIDTAGVALLRDWIASLTACQSPRRSRARYRAAAVLVRRRCSSSTFAFAVA